MWRLLTGPRHKFDTHLLFPVFLVIFSLFFLLLYSCFIFSSCLFLLCPHYSLSFASLRNSFLLLQFPSLLILFSLVCMDLYKISVAVMASKIEFDILAIASMQYDIWEKGEATVSVIYSGINQDVNYDFQNRSLKQDMHGSD